MEILRQQQIQCLQADALQYIGQADCTDFDIIFIDPPYHSGLLQDVVQQLKLKPGALVYLEHNRDESPELPENWQQRKDKTAGQIQFGLYEITA